MRICLCALGQGGNTSITEISRLARSLPFGEGERERLLSIKNPSVAKSSLCALLALERACGGERYGDIARTELGKPYFADPSAPAFSLSHTDGISAAMLGDEDEGRVGLDVEAVRKSFDCERIAARFFEREELEAFRASGNDPLTFFRIWTAKEARVKLGGEGLAAHFSGKSGVLGELFTRSYVLRSRNNDARRAVLCAVCEHETNNVEWIDSEEFEICFENCGK